jgi:hypothetical protein
VGVNNTGTSTTVLAATVSGGAGLRVTNGTSGGDASADGIQGYATGDSNAGIFGRNNANKGVGVFGAAPSGTGVFGDSSDGFGVGGRSTNGTGVRGESMNATGVYGQSNGNNTAGVYGNAANGLGVLGNSTNSIGVYGISTNNWGVFGYSGNSSSYAAYFSGNVAITGGLTVYGSPKSAAVPHPDGSHRRLYCLEAPESYFEDVGRGQLTNGRGQVSLDAEFAALVRTDDFEVFLTPRGDCKGLYVASQSVTGFEVRELQAGTSTLQFGYRVMARRKDIPGPRLERVARPTLPPSVDGVTLPTPTSGTPAATVAPSTSRPNATPTAP